MWKISAGLLLAFVLLALYPAHADPANCAAAKTAPPAIGSQPTMYGGRTVILPMGWYFIPRPLDGQGSMVPIADWGHTLIVRQAEWTDLRVHQLILFRPPAAVPLPEGADAVFHQVVGLGEDEAGEVYAVTQGIANCYPDPWLVRPGDLLGIVVGVWYGG